MKVLMILHFLWACLMAVGWGLDTASDWFDVLLAGVCYAWVICAFGMFFRARWAWWGSVSTVCAVTLFFSAAMIKTLYDVAVGRTLPMGEHWSGWTLTLTLYLPTVGLLLALLVTKKTYAKQRPPAMASTSRRSE
jgi:hypothetical protein